MRKNKAERRSCNDHRSYASMSRDADIIANFERGCTYAAFALIATLAVIFIMAVA